MAAIALAACESVPTTTPVEASDRAEAGDVRGVEARFVEIEREVPGFGGYFFAADGAVAAYVAEPGSAPAARVVLARVLAERTPSARDRRTGELRVLAGRYSFSQLAAWRDRLMALLPMPGVVFVDADEAFNRVRIGVWTNEARLAVPAAAVRLGVPLEALVLSDERSLRPLVRLADAAGPLVPGGYRVSFASDLSTIVQCSLGFNVLGLDDAGYVTAAHCSRVQGRTDRTVHQQPGESELLGMETADPLMFRGGACPADRRCRYSDAARFRYAPGHVADPAIARTAEPGSREVAGTLRVAGESPYPVAGEMLDKVGAETGWTFGAVAATCVHVNVDGTDVTLLCQDVVDAEAEGGDSGGPVFAWRGGEATLAGVLWGGTGKRFYFSAMGNVEAELGPLTTW
ncbi:MAG TPA: hypothetical protein VIB55_18775 [Longimicrobium sp.]